MKKKGELGDIYGFLGGDRQMVGKMGLSRGNYGHDDVKCGSGSY